MTRLLRAVRLALAAVALCRGAAAAEPRHGIAMYGEPALPPDFVSLPYANPDAPKGGTIVFGETGGFDSLNPYILKGRAPAAIESHVFETLMARNWDEPFGLYGLLAESIETGPEREWVEFTLRPEARFSDGSPVTVEDVIWSMETLAEKGLPRYRNAWEKVAEVEQTGERSVRFTFDARRQRAAADHRAAADPEEGGLGGDRLRREQPAGAGGVGALHHRRVRAGAVHHLRARTRTTGGRDLPINRGVNNFDTVRYDYFVDAGVLFQAFTAGELSVYRELSPAQLAGGVRLPGGGVGGDRQGGDPARAAVGDGGVRLQHPAADLPGLAGARRAAARVQLRVRQPDAERRGVAAAGELFRQLGRSAMGSGPAEGRVRELLEPFADEPGAGRARRLCAAGLGRVGAQPGEHAGGGEAARGGGLDGAGRGAAECGRASRSPSRSC